MSKHLKFVLKSGFAEDDNHTEKDTWVQFNGEDPEELANRIYERIRENIDQLLSDEEGEDDDELDEDER